MSQIRVNESGFKIKECPECKRDININSFNGDICVSCHEDINDVKIWQLTEGDFNDVYNRKIVRATGKEIDQLLRAYFTKDAELDDMATDGIGYGILNSQGQYDYYVEAIEIENTYNEKIEIDLTENNNGEGSD
jgi:hypothetical protein